MVLGLIGGLAAGAGALFGSSSQNRNAEAAADAQAEAARLSAGVVRSNFLDTVRLNQGRAQAGDAATAQMLQLMGLPVPTSLTSGAAYDSIYGSGGGGGGPDLSRWGGFDPDAYLAANPDVADHFNSTVAPAMQNGWNEPFYLGDQRVEVQTPQDWAFYHYQNHGRSEGRNLGTSGGGGGGMQPYMGTGKTNGLGGAIGGLVSDQVRGEYYPAEPRAPWAEMEWQPAEAGLILWTYSH